MIKSIILSALIIGGMFCTIVCGQVPCRSGKLNPDAKMVLQYMPDMTLEQERSMSVEERRNHVPPDLDPVPESKMQRIKITADSIPVIVFRPDNTDGKTLPVVIDYHGGAFVAPLQPWMYQFSYGLANSLNAIVFAVDYRVAPEYRFPVAVNDSYNAFTWLADNAGRFGGDTSRIMLNGVSAGGNLAAVVSLLARDNGRGNKIKMMLLFCPAVDNPLNSTYPSITENATGYGITKNTLLWVTENYSSNLAKDTTDFRMFPIKAKYFKDLPPTLIFTAEFDVLRDEGLAYAAKLREAGVPVIARCFAGQVHTFMGLAANAPEWKQIDEDTRAYIKKYL